MNLLAIFSRPKPYEREAVAGLRDEVIHLGTSVRFIEDMLRNPVKRDSAGRFVSTRPDTRKQLADFCASLTPDERAAALSRGARKGRTG